MEPDFNKEVPGDKVHLKRTYSSLGIYDKWEMRDEIIDMVMRSYTSTEIAKHLRDKWGITSHNTAFSTIAAAKKEFFDIERVKVVEEKRELYLAQYQNLLKIAVDKAVQTGQTKNAKELIDSMAKLDGLYIQKQEISVVDNFKIEL